MANNGRRMPEGPRAGQNASGRHLVERAGPLLSQNRGAEAIKPLLQASVLMPVSPEVAHMLGVAYLQAGKRTEAIAALKKAARLAPANAIVLDHLGVALCQAGLADDGIAALEKAITLAPQLAAARNNLAHALSQAGRYAEAASAYRAVVAQAPQMQPAWQGLMASLQKSGDLGGALAAAEQAVARFGDNSGFFASLGRILIDLRRPTPAEQALRRALALDGTNGEAANNLATLIEETGHQQEALDLYRLATRSRPDLADGWFNLGNALEKRADLPAARQALERAAALRPSSAKTLAALIAARRKLCDWAGLDAQVAQLRAMIAVPQFSADPEDAPSPFGMLSLMLDPDAQLQVARVHSAGIVAKVKPLMAELGALERQNRLPGARLRVGYLSPDFREHPVAQLMAGVFEAHDRDRFEISAWSLGPDDASPYRRRIEAGVDRFEDIRALDTVAATRLMREAGLDIVVDLAGYTAHARPEILALRAAPVQVNYLGYPGSMGAGFIDYALVDQQLAGADDDRFYSERLVRLPGCYQANDDKAPIDAGPVTRAEFGLAEDAFVFCSFSMNYKIDAAVMDAWTDILRQTPGSMLWLFRTDAAAANNLRREFCARGLEPERLVFADRLAKPKHLARHRLADLFLDTFSYGAHTTASDALWAGLPVLTLRGDSFARRVGASIVTAAGLPELVAHSVDDYVRRAVAVARAPEKARALASMLAENLPTCPLFSTRAIARNLETAYLGMIADGHNEPEV